MALKSGTRVLIRHDARVLLSAPGSALAVQLDNGLVVVYARGGQVPVHVPAVQAVLTGEVFGVWAKGDSLVTAVIDGEVSLHTPVVDSKYAKGREIKLSQRGPLPLVLAQQLEIEVERSERAGARYHLSGKTTPNAELFARKGGRFEAVELSSSGTFTVELDTKEPQLGDVVAYDAAGRRAEVNVPSETLDDVLASLAKGQPIERRTGATLPLPGAGEKAAAREEPAEVKGGEKAAKGEVVQPAQPKGETPETVAIPNPGNPKAAKEQEKKGKTEHIPRGSEPTPVSIDLPGMPKDKPAETGGKKGKKAEPAEKGAEKADKPAEDPNKPVEVQFE